MDGWETGHMENSIPDCFEQDWPVRYYQSVQYSDVHFLHAWFSQPLSPWQIASPIKQKISNKVNLISNIGIKIDWTEQRPHKRLRNLPLDLLHWFYMIAWKRNKQWNIIILRNTLSFKLSMVSFLSQWPDQNSKFNETKNPQYRVNIYQQMYIAPTYNELIQIGSLVQTSINRTEFP